MSHCCVGIDCLVAKECNCLFTCVCACVCVRAPQDPRCAKVATVNALVSLALSDPSREHLHTLTAQQHTTPSTSFPHKPSRPRDAQSPRPDSAKVTQAVQGAATLFPALSTPDAVLKRVLLALWSAPKQLHKLMSSSNTKQGRYVDAEIVRPLTALSLHCTRQLSYMADEEPLARQMLQALGVASRINTTFLQVGVEDGADAVCVQ